MLTSINHKKNIFDTLGRHTVHPFPARMAPGIALDALSKARRRLRVLDPMMGSGTVLAVARAKGHKAVGTDLDPLAVLLSKVWTRSVDRKRAVTKARCVLKRARALFRTLAQADAYPRRSDEETKEFVRYWFDAYVRRQLTALSIAISRVRETAIREVLWCAFSRLIITKNAGASLAMDLSHIRNSDGKVCFHSSSEFGQKARTYTPEEIANIRRRKGIFSNNEFKRGPRPDALHHLKIFYNNQQRARLYYKMNGNAVRFIQNRKP